MLVYYLTLDLPLDATDQQIREAYLQKVKKYTPEKDPEKFRKINDAYEAIKDKRSRVRTKLFFAKNIGNHEQQLLDLAQARKFKRRRAGLQDLIEVVKNETVALKVNGENTN